MKNTTKKLTAFLNGAHSVYHAVNLLVRELETAGYSRLNEGEKWDL